MTAISNRSADAPEFVQALPPMKSGADKKNLWDDRLAPLREAPGQWAVFRDVLVTLGTRIKRGAVGSGFTPGSFEATGRNVTQNGRCDLYVRYVGENGEHR